MIINILQKKLYIIIRKVNVNITVCNLFHSYPITCNHLVYYSICVQNIAKSIDSLWIIILVYTKQVIATMH